jgi:hypothetical protein
LVLSSGTSKKELQCPSAPWLKLLSDRFDLETGKLTAVLPQGDGFGQPLVKVSLTAPPCEDSGNTRAWYNLETAIDGAVKLASGSKPAPSTESVDERLLAPVAVDFAARRRFSVSRLSGELQLPPDRTAIVTPSADEEAGTAAISSMDLGTFVHRVLAAIPLSGKIDTSTLVMNSFCDTAEDLQSEALPLIEIFRKSARAAELTAAKQVYRELEFMLAWPPEQPQAASQPPRYLQGFIDCLYQDQRGRWRLVDYKTNRISADRLVDAAAAYEMQLGVYALAATQILGEPPAELSIHFLRPSLEHSFVWDDAMRRRVIGRVDKAIESVLAGNHRLPRTEIADSA